MKVKNFYNKNQFIILGDKGEIEFQSYNSRVARIDKSGTLELSTRWDYSKTTLKHLYLFLKEYLYNLDSFIQDDIKKILLYSKNKKKDIQRLIDEERIFTSLRY